MSNIDQNESVKNAPQEQLEDDIQRTKIGESLQPSRGFWILLLGSMVFVGVLAYLQYTRVDESRNRVGTTVGTLPVISQIPEFTLTDQNGKKVTLDDLKDNVWIADFIFTTCGGPCPLMTDRMREVQQEIVKRNLPRVKTVSFTVDPETDTPKVLKEYAEYKQAEKYDWHFLTGEQQTIHKMCFEAFKMPVRPGDESHEVQHSPRFVLVDQKGRVRGYYEAVTDEELIKRFNGEIIDAPMNPESKEKLLKDVMTLLREETRRR